MRLPESFIRLMNPIIYLILATPLRFFFIRTLLVLRVSGRRTGRSITTPLRYEKNGDQVRCFTSMETFWWRNVKAAEEVELLIGGRWFRASAQVTLGDPDVLLPALEQMLRIYPQDAAYQNIRMVAGQPHPDDLQMACRQAVLVDFKLLSG